MTALTRWDPYRELATMRNMMDRMMDEEVFGLPRLWERRSEFNLALDIAETDDAYVVKASVPGAAPEDEDRSQEDRQRRLILPGNW